MNYGEIILKILIVLEHTQFFRLHLMLISERAIRTYRPVHPLDRSLHFGEVCNVICTKTRIIDRKQVHKLPSYQHERREPDRTKMISTYTTRAKLNWSRGILSVKRSEV